jgi:glutamate-1-semialdehyde 2,1-aminomutase
MESASGAYLFDADGNSYLDFVNSWGPMICGHSPPEVVEAVREQASRAMSFGACCELENRLAEKIRMRMPSLERLRFVTSGTEACMSAARLARAYTRRPKLIKFAGNYHGHFDAFLVQAGSGVATLGLPDSPGVNRETTSQTISAPYNDLHAVEQALCDNPDQVAAIIAEPVVGNSGCLLPKAGFLEGLRKLCDRHGALLILDEVMTGFRVAAGGAQGRFGIHPDLTTLGKIVGGGMPVGAYGGRREIMDMVAPAGPMYQSGTLAGHPLGMVAGYETLRLSEAEGFYESLEAKSDYLRREILAASQRAGVPVTVNSCGAMLTAFFSDQEDICDFEGAKSSHLELYARFFRGLLERGVYFPPSQFEAAFFSAAMGERELETFLEAADQSLRDCARVKTN